MYIQCTCIHVAHNNTGTKATVSILAVCTVLLHVHMYVHVDTDLVVSSQRQELDTEDVGRVRCVERMTHLQTQQMLTTYIVYTMYMYMYMYIVHVYVYNVHVYHNNIQCTRLHCTCTCMYIYIVHVQHTYYYTVNITVHSLWSAQCLAH